MKKLKMIALATILALPAALCAPSQAKPGDAKDGKGKMGAGGREGRMGGRQGGRRGPGGMMRRMAKELNITPAQQTKMDALMKDNRAKMEAIRDNKSLSREQKMAKMKAARESSMAKFNAILTPAQRSKVAAMQKQMEARMRERMGQGGRPGGAR